MAEHARGTFAVTLAQRESGLPMLSRSALEARDGLHHYDLAYDLPDA